MARADESLGRTLPFRQRSNEPGATAHQKARHRRQCRTAPTVWTEQGLPISEPKRSCGPHCRSQVSPPAAGIVNVSRRANAPKQCGAVCSLRHDNLCQGIRHDALLCEDANKAIRCRGTAAHAIDVRPALASPMPPPLTVATATRDTPLLQLDHRQSVRRALRIRFGIQGDRLSKPTAHANVAAGIDDTEGTTACPQALRSAVDCISFGNASQVDP